MGRRPKTDLSKLIIAAQQHLDRARELGKSLDERLRAKKSAAADWIPDDLWRADFKTVSETLRDAGAMMLRATEAHKNDLQELTEEQLEAQLKAELPGLIPQLTDEEWEQLVAIRAKGR